MDSIISIISVFIIFSILEIIKAISKNKDKIRKLLEVIKDEECVDKSIESKKLDDNMRDDSIHDIKSNK